MIRLAILIALSGCSGYTDRDVTPVAVRDTDCQDNLLEACRADWFDEILVCTEGRWRPMRNCSPERCAQDEATGRFDCVEWK